MKTNQRPKLTYHSLKSFLSYAQRYRWRFIPVALSFVVANISLAIIPYFIGKLIGSLAMAKPDTDAALTYVIILIACSTIHDLLWRLSELLYVNLINPVSFNYETLVFQHIVQKPYQYFVDKFTGKVSSYTSTLSQEYKGFLEDFFWNYTGEIVTLITIIAILLSVNIATGVIFIIGISLMLIAGYFTLRLSNHYEKVFTDIQSTKNGRIIDIIANFASIKSFRTERKEIAAVAAEQDKTIRSNRQSFMWGLAFWGSMSFIVREMMWPAAIVLNYYLFIHGQIGIGEFTTLLTTILLFSNFIWEVIWNVSQFNLRLARAEEAYTYLFGSENIGRAESKLQPLRSAPTFRKVLNIIGLSFSYPDSPKPVLRSIDLAIKHGEKVGIVGKSGSGKSTLTKLLLGYYETTPGSLQIDGLTLSGRALSSLISFVPQDSSLFHRSVADNIAYASERPVSRANIVVAAKQAHADEFITQIEHGYDALVGERGVKLSAGQRQRIAIARAFLDDKPILVMDEATSALDSESEVLVQEALEALWQDKTVIAIAHRLSTLRHMDRIVVMANGQITEQGSHDELLKLKGTYAKLWTHQSGGFIEE